MGGIVVAVAENVRPPYYFTPDSIHPNKPTDPCNDSILSSSLGLDKDGNNLYGLSDSACSPSDTTPPTVVITYPANGQTVSGVITLTASASDDVGVVGVQFEVDGVAFGGEDLMAPYSVSWDTTKVSNGPHVLKAVARDGAGNSAISSAVTVTVGNTPPEDNVPDMSVWVEKWFEVTFDDGEDSQEVFPPVLTQGEGEGHEDLLGYMKIWTWNPANRVLAGDLYLFDAGAGQWYIVELPLHYISGKPLNFLCWSEVEGEGEGTYGFTARFNGKKKRNVLVSAMFKTKPRSHAILKKVSQSASWHEWLRMKCILIDESAVPVPEEAVLH